MDNRISETGAQLVAAFNADPEAARKSRQVFPAETEASQPYFQPAAAEPEAVCGDQTRVEITVRKSALYFDRESASGNPPHLGTDRRTALLAKALARRIAQSTRLYQGQPEAGS